MTATVGWFWGDLLQRLGVEPLFSCGRGGKGSANGCWAGPKRCLSSCCTNTSSRIEPFSSEGNLGYDPWVTWASRCGNWCCINKLCFKLDVNSYSTLIRQSRSHLQIIFPQSFLWSFPRNSIHPWAFFPARSLRLLQMSVVNEKQSEKQSA